jgi:cytochrome c oxidase cbb3-type subunit 1/cytochrome c oxidase cbb3-type subunit I/II
MATEDRAIVNAEDATPDDEQSGVEDNVRWHLMSAGVFLALALGAGSVASLQLVFPELGTRIAALSYGRLSSAAIHLFLYGWLALGFLAAVYFVLPRISGRSVKGEWLALISLMAIAVAAASGAVLILGGLSDGRPYLEAPVFSEALLLVGLILSTVVVSRTIAQDVGQLVPAQWYLLGSSWWAVLLVAFALLPGLPGAVGAMQIGFFRAGLAGFWFATAGVGFLYYLVPKLTGQSSFEGSPFSALGFWSLAFVWAATGPVLYVYGPVPGWLQSVGVAFSIALFVPVALIARDLSILMRGRARLIEDRVTFAFASVGMLLLVLVPVHNLVQALRTSSSVVGLTEWNAAGDLLLFGGAFTFWLFAFGYHASGAGSSRRGLCLWHLGLSFSGLAIAVSGMWIAGVATGLTWAADVNTGEFTAVGVGWSLTDWVLEPFLGMRAAGTVLFGIAQVLFLVVVFTASWRVSQSEPNIDDEAFDLQLAGDGASISRPLLRGGIIATFGVVVILTVFVPWLDPSVSEATILADTARSYPDGSAAADGRAVYVREGCVACHTQSVRPIVPDVGLGPVSVAGDYANEAPALVGVERLGPDLMHVGSRLDDADALGAHLDDPRADRPWSIMPSYRYLTQGDLDALTEYLLSLR